MITSLPRICIVRNLCHLFPLFLYFLYFLQVWPSSCTLNKQQPFNRQPLLSLAWGRRVRSGIILPFTEPQHGLRSDHNLLGLSRRYRERRRPYTRGGSLECLRGARSYLQQDSGWGACSLKVLGGAWQTLHVNNNSEATLQGCVGKPCEGPRSCKCVW